MYISEFYSDLMILEYNPEIFIENYLEEFSLDPLKDLKNKIAILMNDLGKWSSDKFSKIKIITGEAKNLARSLKNDIRNISITQGAEKIKLSIQAILSKFKNPGRLTKTLIGIVIALLILSLCLFLFTTFPVGGYIIILIPISIYFYNRFRLASDSIKDGSELLRSGDIDSEIYRAAEKTGIKNEKILRVLTGIKKGTLRKLEGGFLKAMENQTENEKSSVAITAMVVKGSYEAITTIEF